MLMNRFIFVFVFLLSSLQSHSQEIYQHQLSSVPDTSRFEIVQSQQGARYTFRIDKYMGIVSQLVEGENQELTWQTIGTDSKLTLDDYLATGTRVNFQLFISGLGIRYVFLIHIHTGTTWQLAQDSETEHLFWFPIH